MTKLESLSGYTAEPWCHTAASEVLSPHSVLYAETEIQVLQAAVEHALSSFALPRAHWGSKKPSSFSGCPQSLCSQGRGTWHMDLNLGLSNTLRKKLTHVCASVRKGASQNRERCTLQMAFMWETLMEANSSGMAQKQEAVRHETEQKWESRHCTPTLHQRAGFLW